MVLLRQKLGQGSEQKDQIKNGDANANHQPMLSSAQDSDSNRNVHARESFTNNSEGGFGDTAGSDDSKKQMSATQMNLISYQTANFGANGKTRPIGADA